MAGHFDQPLSQAYGSYDENRCIELSRPRGTHARVYTDGPG